MPQEPLCHQPLQKKHEISKVGQILRGDNMVDTSFGGQSLNVHAPEMRKGEAVGQISGSCATGLVTNSN